jgi:hypothetical protein
MVLDCLKPIPGIGKEDPYCLKAISSGFQPILEDDLASFLREEKEDVRMAVFKSTDIKIAPSSVKWAHFALRFGDPIYQQFSEKQELCGDTEAKVREAVILEAQDVGHWEALLEASVLAFVRGICRVLKRAEGLSHLTVRDEGALPTSGVVEIMIANRRGLQDNIWWVREVSQS